MDTRIDEAIDLLLSNGWIDGAHHKQWVIDQTLRLLCESEGDYQSLIDELKEQQIEWDTGIEP